MAHRRSAATREGRLLNERLVFRPRRDEPGRSGPPEASLAAGARRRRNRAHREAEPRAQRRHHPPVREGARARTIARPSRRAVPRRALPAEGPRVHERRRSQPQRHAVPEEARLRRAGGYLDHHAVSRRRGSSSSAGPTLPKWGSRGRPSLSLTARRETPGTRSTRPAGRAAAAPLPWPRGWCPRPVRATGAARSASRRASAASSVSSRLVAGSRSAR